MGLDNGIKLRTKQEIDPEMIPYYVKVTRDTFTKNAIEYDVCYWRKCWNIRHEVLSIIGRDTTGSNDFELNSKQIKEIRDTLLQMLCYGEDWDDGSIWTFEEMIPRLAQDAVDLTWLLKYLEEDKTAYAYFYDSY